MKREDKNKRESLQFIPIIYFKLIFFFPLLLSSIWAQSPWPTQGWVTATPEEMGLDPVKLNEAKDISLQSGGAGYITRSGKLVLSWGDTKRKWDIKSATKGIGMTAVGLAILDGKLELSDSAGKFHPDLNTGILKDIKIEHLASHTSGFDKGGGDNTNLLFDPGDQFSYSDAGPNWLAECLTLIYQKDVSVFLMERVFSILGLSSDDISWRSNWYRPDLIDGIKRREFGAGAQANADAMARIGYLYLREGKWEGQQILPIGFSKMVGDSIPRVAKLSAHSSNCCGDPTSTGYLWWQNDYGQFPNVPRDAYWTWGLYNNHTLVIPSFDMVVSRVSSTNFPDSDPGPFFTAISEAVVDPGTRIVIHSPSYKKKESHPALPLFQSWSHAKAFFNSTGKNYRVYKLNGQRINGSLSNLSSGLYFFRMEGKDKNIRGKVIIAP